MNAWTCIVPGRPKTKGNHGRIVKIGGFSKLIPSAAAVKGEGDARSFIAAHAPASPFTGAVDVDVVFVFAVAQGKRKGKHRIDFGAPCMLSVDRGNLLKLIEDAMNGIVYLDDKQVVGGDVSKVWGDLDETRITVRPVGAVGGVQVAA